MKIEVKDLQTEEVVFEGDVEEFIAMKDYDDELCFELEELDRYGNEETETDEFLIIKIEEEEF